MTEHTILAPIELTDLAPIELTDTELDAVSGGRFQANVAVAAVTQVQKVTFDGQKIGIAVQTAVGVIVEVGNNVNVDVNVL